MILFSKVFISKFNLILNFDKSQVQRFLLPHVVTWVLVTGEQVASVCHPLGFTDLHWGLRKCEERRGEEATKRGG